jgi:uncharacterized protein YyaL (SSP411 family)
MNRLANARSSYLREASEQPVDWYPWSDEAFERARIEDKPILVDVGASWCHWCHVMDRESYSNPEIANIINKYFIAIKVDRDEMPDIDRELQNAVSAISGEGGWPLTAFLTHDRKVFFGGTYFPPEDKYGRIGFKKLLTQIALLWKENRKELLESAEGLYNALNSSQQANEEKLNEDFIEVSIADVLPIIDWENGGIMSSQKFPHPPLDIFLLSYSFRSGDEIGFKASLNTLRKMCYGGIFDQIGGGFHRYTVDRQWWIPHFEKLTIDNAEIIMDLTNLYSFYNDLEILDCLEMTVNYLIRDMKVGDLFASSEDADSEGVEGKYYTWTEKELNEALGKEDKLIKYLFSFDVNDGFVEGRKVLKRAFGLKELSITLNLSIEESLSYLRGIRKALFEYREKNRKRPFRDDNTYTYQNMRVAEAILKTYGIVNEGKFTFDSLKVVNSINRVTRRMEGGKDGLLEDYASSILALISAYEVTGELKYLDKAIGIVNNMNGFKGINSFNQNKGGNYEPIYDTPNESGNAMALKALIKLSFIKPDEFSLKDQERILSRLASLVNQNNTPFMAGILLNIDAIINGVCHIVVIDEGDGVAERLHREAFKVYYPFKVVELIREESRKDKINPIIRSMLNYGNGSRAYVCIGNKCSMPVNKVEDLRKLIK